VSVPFRELEVWQVSMRLASTVHLLSAGFAEGEHAALALSLQQASAAIPVDIAEGHGAGCLSTFTQRLSNAQAACERVTSGLHDVRASSLGNAEMVDECLSLADRVGRMLLRLHQALSRKLQADVAVTGSLSR
jgi:four helix bundle protein